MNELYRGDCHEIMPDLPAKSVKLVMLDMPYCITNDDYDLDFAQAIVGKRRRLDYSVLDDRMAMHNYLLDTLLPALRYVCADDAVIVATSSKGFSAVLNFAWGDYKVDEGVWVKSNHTNQAHLKRKMPAKHEHISVFSFSKKYTFNPLMGVGKPYKGFRSDFKTTGKANGNMKSVHNENLGTRYLGGVFYYAREVNGKHSTPKPLGLWKDLVSIFSNEGDLVLDPFAGSGTTAVSCIKLNRNFVCIEKDIGYFSSMLERLEKI